MKTTEEDYIQKTKETEDIINPVLTKIYSSNTDKNFEEKNSSNSQPQVEELD